MKTPVFIVTVIVLIVLIAFVFYFGDMRSFRESLDEHEEAVACAYALHAGIVRAAVVLDSQCLGICGAYAVDLVHVPRSASDDLPENQCREYREGKVAGLIELDATGTIVQIIDA